MKRLRGGLIGCGFVSLYHLEAWSQVVEAELVAVCDMNPQRLGAALGRLPAGTKGFTDAEAMLRKDPALDFVEICTRPEAHRPLTELCASAGAHVLCQKPAAPTREDLVAMIDACDDAGVRLMIHENWRFRPWYRAMKAAIEGGAIGRPIRLRLAHRDTRALRAGGFDEQPYFREMPRLILYEMGPHLIDTARYLMGEVSHVAAVVDRFGDGHIGDDAATLTLRFADGGVGLVDICWCSSFGISKPEWALNETIVEGTRGSLVLRQDASIEHMDLNGAAVRLVSPLPHPGTVYVEGYAETQRHFLRGLLEGFDHETSGRATLRTMDVIWGAYLAAQERRWVALSQPG